MNERFFDLKKEKQDRMINAALKVFGENGFKRASTDEMVKEAEISKGLLFHYFESKQGLYDFVIDYSIRYMMMELSGVASTRETDYFEIYRQVMNAKLSVFRIYPHMQNFINSVMAEKQDEISIEIAQKRYDYQEFYQSIFERADLSGFAPSADVEKIGNMIEYTVNGLMQEIEEPDKMISEALSYIAMMKKLCVID